jgi:hypothetical protein
VQLRFRSDLCILVHASVLAKVHKSALPTCGVLSCYSACKPPRV